LLVIRNVPVRECQLGHRFFKAQAARALEQLFEMAHQNQLSPIEIMQVPVVRLELTT